MGEILCKPNVNLTSFRLQGSGENWSKNSAKNCVRAGERKWGEERKHCFKYLIPVYQFLVYPLIGLFLTVYFNTYVIHLASRALNEKTSRADQPRVVRILDNCLQDFPNNALIWAKAGPLALYLTRRKDVFAMLPTGFGKSIIFQLFPLVFTCSYICKALRSLSSKIVVSPLFSIIREQVEQLKRSGFSAATIEMGGCY